MACNYYRAKANIIFKSKCVYVYVYVCVLERERVGRRQIGCISVYLGLNHLRSYKLSKLTPMHWVFTKKHNGRGCSLNY